ncbi:MAG: hypothetical protein FP824_10005, partial [Euryarchaeota archaeon]|nr:hypothetical protein [Euryarchaeota archaeon]
MDTYRKKSFAVMSALLMTVMIFQNVSADEYNTGEDMDMFIDSFGNEHQVWRELVNGTYQIFYGYQIVDTVYNTNWASYVNQTINSNIDFDDGYLTIQNCTINGNIKITRGNVLIQNCVVYGNVKIDLGRIRILNSNINGNLDTKNADLEMRYTQLNGNVNAKQSTYEDVSEIIIGNDINGNVKIKGGICYIVGNTINGNLDVNDPAIIQQVIDNDVNGNIKLNENTEGFYGYQITNSTMNTQYPQCAVDSVTGLGYVLWVENDFDLYYAGTEDFVTWSEPIFIGSIVAYGNPELELAISNGTLTIIWENGGLRSFAADIDGDFIPDVDDELPMEYNFTPGDVTIIPDAVAVDIELGISVAIDYADNATEKPTITLASIPLPEGNIGQSVNITTTCNQSFTAYIKFGYDASLLPETITELYLRAYWLTNDGWKILKNTSAGEDTGIDVEGNIVWATTHHFCSLAAVDSSFMDSDEDGLTDAEEINADGTPDAQITSFADGSTSKSLSFLPEETHTLSLNVPVSYAGIERVASSRIDVTPSLYAYEEHHIPTYPSNMDSPDIYRDKIVYKDDRNGNWDIFLMDLTTGVETQITDDPTHDVIPTIWGEYIFWYRNINILLVQNYVTGEEWQVGSGYAGDIYNNYIVWPGVLYDIHTQTTKSISSTGNPCIYGDYVASVNYVAHELHLYKISTETTKIINPVGTDPLLLDISERYVLYLEGNELDLYVYDIFSEETTRITDNSHLENDPAIFGNTAVWCGHRFSPYNNIYGYDLVANKEFPICMVDGWQLNPAIYEDTIVWSDFRDGVHHQLYSAVKTTPIIYISIDGQVVAEAEIIDGSCTIPDISPYINKYLGLHQDSDDGVVDGCISVPISFSSNGAGEIDITQLSFDVYVVSTDPVDADTDDDLLLDGEEVLIHKTNPLHNDSDYDNLSDFEEVATYGTNPNKADTDDDGMKDGDEIEAFINILGYDSFWSDFWGLDADNDGLFNGAFDPDTDEDGLLDKDEILDVYIVNHVSKQVPMTVTQYVYGNEYQVGAWIYNFRAYGTLHEATCSYSWDIAGGQALNIVLGYSGGTPIYLTTQLKSGTINMLSYWNKDILSSELDWYFRIYYKVIEHTHVTINTFTFTLKCSTDSTVCDTDMDRLTDKDEKFVYLTSPVNPDSDFDMLTDGEEVLDMVFTQTPLSFSTSGNFGGGVGTQTKNVGVLFNVVGHPELDTVTSRFVVTDYGMVRPKITKYLRYDSGPEYQVSSVQNILSLYGETPFLNTHTWYLKLTYDVWGDEYADYVFSIDMTFVSQHPDPLNPDTDGDGCIDSSDEFPLDPNESSDTDGDLTGNNEDIDDDGDGVEDIQDKWPLNPTGANDTDGDGMPDEAYSAPDWYNGMVLTEDEDDDGDYIPDIVENEDEPADDDNIPNRLDSDSDDDTIPDIIEGRPDHTNPPNTDNTGSYDFLDLDSDDDGIPDSVEGWTDVDDDESPNYRDLDSDDDGKLDSIEGIGDDDSDNIPNFLDADDANGPTGDTDGDGVPNDVEGMKDSDHDGLEDYRDDDDDDDTILTRDEDLNGDGDPTNDHSDSDGVPNYLDNDDDGDTVLTRNELPTNRDLDEDGTPDYLDTDDDGDWVPTAIEYLHYDTDYDKILNYLDDDDDGDTILTRDEDLNGDGDPTNDHTENDWIPNYLDNDDDNDGFKTKDEIEIYKSDWLKLDTDDDGVPDGNDMDPLIDLVITVKITEIRALEAVDSPSEADFYTRVSCDRAKISGSLYTWVTSDSTIPIKFDNSHLTPSDLTNAFIFNVPDSEELRLITIDLFDYDGSPTSDDWCDIDGDSTVSEDEYSSTEINDDGRTMFLVYSLKTGQWTGGDYPNDPNGYGHASGEEDDDPRDQDDCELWFDIRQDDRDADELTYGQEIAIGTNPTMIDSPTGVCPLGDIDGDGLPNWYECKQDIRWPPSIIDMDAGGDTDYDGLSNLEEYTLRPYNSNPYRPDLFVEMDYLEGCGIPPSDSIESVIKMFSEITTTSVTTISGGIHLVVQIDQEIPFVHEYIDEYGTLRTLNLIDGTRVNEFDANIVENNYHQNENTHVYCLIVGTIQFGILPDGTVDDNGYGGADPDFGFMIASNYLQDDFGNNIDAWKIVFAHELGHCIGIGLTITETFNGNTGFEEFAEIPCVTDACLMAYTMSITGDPSTQINYCHDCLSSSLVTDLNFYFSDTKHDSSWDEYILMTARLFNKFSV